MTSTKIPSLGYALLGLLQQKPCSGYDLRKIFSSTSMKTYSDSPGAIYPALGRLEKQGLIRGTIEEGSGLRRRQVFHVTARGLAELKSWILQPVTPAGLTHGYEQIILRFAFSERVAGTAAAVELLKSLQAALTLHVCSLQKEFDASKDLMPTSARLAFESGVRGTESFLLWTRDALATYERQKSSKRKE